MSFTLPLTVIFISPERRHDFLRHFISPLIIFFQALMMLIA